jgi:hypothetical protein
MVDDLKLSVDGSAMTVGVWDASVSEVAANSGAPRGFD